MSKSGKLLVQNIQLVLGLLYHVSISHQGGNHLCRECRLLEHELTLTRDRNKEFHICQHTTRHSELTLATSLPSSKRHEVVFENCTCSLMPLRTHTSSDKKSRQQDYLTWMDESRHAYSSNLNCYVPLHVEQKCYGGEHCIVKPEGTSCQFQTTEKLHHLHPLHVATYNIWNVNSLPDVKESYDVRIARLGKVSWTAPKYPKPSCFKPYMTETE